MTRQCSVTFPRIALRQVQGVARPAEVGLRAEVPGFHHQRIAFPTAPRVSHPLPHGLGEVRPAVQRDDARLVDELLEDDDVAGNLEGSDSCCCTGATADAATRVRCTASTGSGPHRELRRSQSRPACDTALGTDSIRAAIDDLFDTAVLVSDAGLRTGGGTTFRTAGPAERIPEVAPEGVVVALMESPPEAADRSGRGSRPPGLPLPRASATLARPAAPPGDARAESTSGCFHCPWRSGAPQAVRGGDQDGGCAVASPAAPITASVKVHAVDLADREVIVSPSRSDMVAPLSACRPKRVAGTCLPGEVRPAHARPAVGDGVAPAIRVDGGLDPVPVAVIFIGEVGGQFI